MGEIITATVYTMISVSVGYVAGHSFASWAKGKTIDQLSDENDELYITLMARNTIAARQAIAHLADPRNDTTPPLDEPEPDGEPL